MSSLNGRELKYAVLHQSIFVPGVGNVKATLVNEDSATGAAVKMTIDGPFVALEFKDKVGAKVSAAIPLTSFSHMVLVKE